MIGDPPASAPTALKRPQLSADGFLAMSDWRHAKHSDKQDESSRSAQAVALVRAWVEAGKREAVEPAAPASAEKKRTRSKGKPRGGTSAGSAGSGSPPSPEP